MKKQVKTDNKLGLFENKLKITIDKNMKPARPVGAIARKIEEAKELFSKVKNIEDILPKRTSQE